MGSGAAFVRVVARRARDRAQPQRGRLRSPGRRRRARRRRAATDVSKGWHTGLDWGSAGIACIRSGGRTAPQLTVLDPATGARDVAAPRRARPSSTPSTSPNPRRSRGPAPTARPCTGCSGSRPRRAARRARRRCWSTCTAAPPTSRPSTGSPASAGSCRAGGRCSAPTTAGPPGYGRAYRHALDHAWGEVDVTDTVAGHPRARARRPRRRVARRGDGRQRGRLHRAARRRAHAAGRARRGEPVRRHRPVRPRRHHAPLRVALPRPSRRHACPSTPTATRRARR